MSTEKSAAPTRRRRWPKAVVGLGIVAVTGAGLGAYMGIRAVAGPGSAPSTGQPPARTGAAMAFDAADGTVVLFGGQGKSGSLGDTWTWDGSSWTQQHPQTSPPALSGAKMTYDPVGHDLVLVGGERLTGGPLEGNVCSSPGSSGSGSASGSGGSGTKWIPPDSAQPADAPAPGNLSTPLINTGCGFPDSSNAATWLWNGTDWTKASGTTPNASFGGWNLVTDPVSDRALLLSLGPWVAEPDLPIAQPAIACPMLPAVTNGETTTSPGCPVFPIANQSWTWTGHEWKTLKVSTSAVLFTSIGSPVVLDAVTGRLAIFAGGLIPATPAQCPTCEDPGPITNGPTACCNGTVSYWNGTAWKASAPYKVGPILSGGTFVGDASTHSDIYLDADGETWIWTGVWSQKHPGTTPPTLEGAAAVYDAQSGQVVMFGGLGTTSRATGLYDQTWTWDGSTWTLRGGSSSPAVSIPIPSPVSIPPSPPCKDVPPPTVPPGTAEPQIGCAGGSSGNSGSGVSGSGAEPGSTGSGGASTGTADPPVDTGAIGL